jgi:hypothetical protein
VCVCVKKRDLPVITEHGIIVQNTEHDEVCLGFIQDKCDLCEQLLKSIGKKIIDTQKMRLVLWWPSRNKYVPHPNSYDQVS